MDEADILRKVLKTFIEERRISEELDAKAKGDDFDIDEFIVEIILIETASQVSAS